MKKRRLFGRGIVPQETPAIEPAPVMEPKPDYAARFLKHRELKARHSVYISKETHAAVDCLVHLLGMAGKEISVGGYIDNVVAEHLESYKDFFADMRRQLLEQD